MTTKALAYLDSKVPGRSQAGFIVRSRDWFRCPQQPGPGCRLHRRRDSTCHLQQGQVKTLGCGDRQAPWWLGRHNRELREDRALADCSVGGLVWRASLSASCGDLPDCQTWKLRSILDPDEIFRRRVPVAQIWPDIPELEGIPEVLRSGIWMKAYSMALRQRKTWVLGLIGLTGLAWICGSLGYQVAGVIGAALGAITGLGIGFAFLVRVVIERKARRLVPEVRATSPWPVVTEPIASSMPRGGSASRK